MELTCFLSMNPPMFVREPQVSDGDDTTDSNSDEENVTDISTLSASFSLEGRPDVASDQD
jgi:hypothetical protein